MISIFVSLGLYCMVSMLILKFSSKRKANQLELINHSGYLVEHDTTSNTRKERIKHCKRTGEDADMNKKTNILNLK
jgi:hypothetical protein